MMITTTRKEGELLDFQILHHSIDMAHVTLKQLPVSWSCLMMMMETMMIKRDGMMTYRVKLIIITTMMVRVKQSGN